MGVLSAVTQKIQLEREISQIWKGDIRLFMIIKKILSPLLCFSVMAAPALAETYEVAAKKDPVVLSNDDDHSAVEQIEDIVLTALTNAGHEAEETSLIIDTNQKVILSAGATPSNEGRFFAGWSTEKDGPIVYPAYQKAEIESSTTLFPVWESEEKTGSLAVNARVNGSFREATTDIATFDVRIDGKTVRTAGTDFYKKYPAGTSFEITNVTPKEGYIFAGAYRYKVFDGCIPVGSLTGRIVAGGITDVTLVFISEDYEGNAGNVARFEPEPRIIEDVAEGDTVHYEISDRPSASAAFDHWTDYGSNEKQSVWTDSSYLDVNAEINGRFKSSTANIAAFDIYINDELSSHNAVDYYKRWPINSRYRIEMKSVDGKYVVEGTTDVPSADMYTPGGGLEGTVREGTTEAQVVFKNRKVTLIADPVCDEGEAVVRELNAA